MKKYFFALIFTLSFANTGLAKEYTIQELLQIAEQNSLIKSAEFSAIAQKNFANQQKYWENPTLNFDQNSNQKNYSLSQSVPFFGKLQSKFNIEDSQYQILQNQKNNLTLLVKAQTFTLLYQYVALKKKIDLAQKRLDRLSLVDKYLSHIVLSSPTQYSQGRITKDKIRLIERDLIKFRNQLFQTWNKVNIYLNLESQPSVSLSWLNEKNYQGKQALIAAALENNLGLKEQKFLLQKYRAELSYAKLEKMPDVNFSITRENAAQTSGAKDANGVGLSVSVPFFNRNQEKILGAESKIKSQEFELDFQKNQLEKDVANDISQFETSLKIAQNFPISEIEKTLTRLNKANNEFKKGILDFITYIELDSQEYQIIDTIIDTQVDLAATYANLMMKIGTFIPPTNEQ